MFASEGKLLLRRGRGDDMGAEVARDLYCRDADASACAKHEYRFARLQTSAAVKRIVGSLECKLHDRGVGKGHSLGNR
jgi:hypothetical protein